jgi:signal transduction histidine kinase
MTPIQTMTGHPMRDGADGRREADALLAANERLNLLTALTRHDVLNDIAALGMYLELLKGPRVPDEEVLGKMSALVGSLRRRMEFTRDYADLGMTMPGWRDMAEVVLKGVAALDTGSLRIDLEFPALEIHADPLFERAVSNIVDNTLRHGGHATFIRFRARMEGDTCILIIEDDGVGIPAGMKESIFKPGFGRNTGLGLFLVREILAITGMCIRETGEPGRGARFEIRIPRYGFRFREGSHGAQGDAQVQA